MFADIIENKGSIKREWKEMEGKKLVSQELMIHGMYRKVLRIDTE